MIFSRIVYCAILAGIVSGLLLSVMQVTALDPIIFAAESFEVEQTAPMAGHGEGHDHAAHEHGADAWAPADGVERTAYTVLANVLAATGFGAVLLALMAQFRLARERDISWPQGLLWGLAGYLAFYAAPAIGLPPEIPGAIAAPVEQRQLWWALTALSVAIGLGLFAFAPTKLKALGVVFLAIPYLIGAPHPHGPMFEHPEAGAVDALIALHTRFVVASAIANLVFWLVLGAACRYAFNRWFRSIALSDDFARA